MDIINLLGGLENADESEDRTLYIRETDDGPKVDFEIIEKTSFRGAFPETTRELRSKGPLPCGHQVSKENPFGGYCRGKKRHLLFQTRPCSKEYCVRCALQCPRCGAFVSANCCSKLSSDIRYCKRCAHRLHRRTLISALVAFLVHPFISEMPVDE